MVVVVFGVVVDVDVALVAVEDELLLVLELNGKMCSAARKVNRATSKQSDRGGSSDLLRADPSSSRPPVLAHGESLRPRWRSAGTRAAYGRHRTADDRAVEALLTSVNEPCTVQQLACGLGWTLDRTLGALRRLEASLANTGLTPEEHRTPNLRARSSTSDRQRAADRSLHPARPQALNATAAGVLHRALTRPRTERTREALRSLAEHAAATALIAAELLIEDNAGVLWSTQRTEATFEATPRRFLR